MATAVVFTPPAVDPGDPPINISTIVSTLETGLSPVWLMVLEPAVRGVTAVSYTHLDVYKRQSAFCP